MCAILVLAFKMKRQTFNLIVWLPATLFDHFKTYLIKDVKYSKLFFLNSGLYTKHKIDKRFECI